MQGTGNTYIQNGIQGTAGPRTVRIPDGRAFLCCPAFIGLVPMRAVTYIDGQGRKAAPQEAAGACITDEGFLRAAWALNPQALYHERLRLQYVLPAGTEITEAELESRKADATRQRKEIKRRAGKGRMPYLIGEDVPVHVIAKGFEGTVMLSQVRFLDKMGRLAPRLLAEWAEILDREAAEAINAAQGSQTKGTDGYPLPPRIPAGDVTLSCSGVMEYDPARKRLLYGLPKPQKQGRTQGGQDTQDVQRATGKDAVEAQGAGRDTPQETRQEDTGKAAEVPAGTPPMPEIRELAEDAQETSGKGEEPGWAVRRLEDGLGYLPQESELTEEVREEAWEALAARSKRGLPDMHPEWGCSPRRRGWCSNDCTGQPVSAYDLRKPYMGFINAPVDAPRIHKNSGARNMAESAACKLIGESIAMAEGDCSYGHGIGTNRFGRYTGAWPDDGRTVPWTADDGWWEYMQASATEETVKDYDYRQEYAQAAEEGAAIRHGAMTAAGRQAWERVLGPGWKYGRRG